MIRENKNWGLLCVLESENNWEGEILIVLSVGWSFQTHIERLETNPNNRR